MDEKNQNSELNEQKDTENLEVEPVKLGKTKTGIICAVAVFCVLIICITVRGCSVTKEVKNSSSSSDTTITQEENSNNSSTKVEDTESKKSENSNSSTESSSSSSKESKASDSKEVTTESNTTEETESNSSKETVNSTLNESALKEADSAVLGSEIDSTGIVSGKSVYLIGNSYLYEVSIVVVTGNNESTVCKYYCPKNTYDALSMGDSLKVTYQSDSSGNKSISTISK